MDIKEKARSQLNWFEKILQQIPGFKGYFEREFRRDSDRKQREFMVMQLQEMKSGLNGIMQTVSRQKNLDLLQVYDLFHKSLEKTINEIRYADQGYSGFFDLLKIREPELDALYELDAQMVELVSRCSAEFKNQAALCLHASGLEPFSRYLDQIGVLFLKRVSLLKGYQPGGNQ